MMVAAATASGATYAELRRRDTGRSTGLIRPGNGTFVGSPGTTD